MTKSTEYKPQTTIVHAGTISDQEYGSVASPIYPSTTFRRHSDGTFRPDVYSRYSTPNRQGFEQAIMEIEGGASCFAYSSGLAASMAVLQILRPGDRLLIPLDVYHGVYTQMSTLIKPYGITIDRVDMTNPKEVENAITPATRMIWIETPSNPMLQLCDLSALVEIANRHSLLTVCDNTWATPLLQRPITLGINIVVHSATKYLSGHSDVLMGVVILGSTQFSSSLNLEEHFLTTQRNGGAVPSAFDCWLAHRGLKTLHVRLREQCASATILAHFLESHPFVKHVFYPGLPSHPQYHLALKQMLHPGAMLSFCINGTPQQAMCVATSTKLFTHATSLGAVESLIEHRASVEGNDSLTPQTLLRLSIGIEHIDDLLDDLKQALLIASKTV